MHEFKKNYTWILQESAHFSHEKHTKREKYPTFQRALNPLQNSPGRSIGTLAREIPYRPTNLLDIGTKPRHLTTHFVLYT